MNGDYVATVKSKSGETLASQKFKSLNEAIGWLRQIERQSPVGGVADWLCIHRNDLLVWRATSRGPNRQKVLLQNALRILAQILPSKRDD